MKFVALVSGGKDSIFTICKLLDEGHELVALLHIVSNETYSDSYMYQTVGSEIAQLLGKCLEVPIYIVNSSCKTLCTSLEYIDCIGDEVEDLYNGIAMVLKNHKFDGISSGAILSTYQKNRVEHVCERLGLSSIAPLWKRDQRELLKEMIDYGLDARIVKVASSFLEKNCLNMTLNEINEYMLNKNSKYETNYCGEGGEYETVVLDAPHFKHKIIVGRSEVVSHPEEKNKENGVYYLVMKDLQIIKK